MSPSRARHPYLLWATLAIGCGFGREALGLWTGREREEGMAEWDFGGEQHGQADGLNGEVLRADMEGWRKRQLLRTGFWGLGWLVTVVGIWGDGA